nr:MAG TPA: hypothetical protein [Caudoviricetes sp.]
MGFKRFLNASQGGYEPLRTFSPLVVPTLGKIATFVASN